MYRRDSTDEKWQEVKDIVHKRDKGRCRLMRVISKRDALILKKNGGRYLSRIDAAHFLAVSDRPELCYDANNICSLNRYSHECLDSNKDPITGASIDQVEVLDWWVRILKGNKAQFEYLVKNEIVGEEYGI